MIFPGTRGIQALRRASRDSGVGSGLPKLDPNPSLRRYSPRYVPAPWGDRLKDPNYPLNGR